MLLSLLGSTLAQVDTCDCDLGKRNTFGLQIYSVHVQDVLILFPDCEYPARVDSQNFGTFLEIGILPGLLDDFPDTCQEVENVLVSTRALYLRSLVLYCYDL